MSTFVTLQSNVVVVSTPLIPHPPSNQSFSRPPLPPNPLTPDPSNLTPTCPRSSPSAQRPHTPRLRLRHWLELVSPSRSRIPLHTYSLPHISSFLNLIRLVETFSIQTENLDSQSHSFGKVHARLTSSSGFDKIGLPSNLPLGISPTSRNQHSLQGACFARSVQSTTYISRSCFSLSPTSRTFAMHPPSLTYILWKPNQAFSSHIVVE